MTLDTFMALCFWAGMAARIVPVLCLIGYAWRVIDQAIQRWDENR